MYQRFKVSNAGSHRKTDENGYLFVDQSPILKAGILEYYGSELIDGGEDDTIKGRKIDPKKVYKVYIPREELIKGADSFKLLPITNDHQWLGREGADAREYQEGTSGDSVTVKGDLLYVPLKFTGDEIIEDLESGDKEELSASYTNELSWADSPDYDFVASDIKGNHIALVEKGRCGSDVRVLNQAMEFKHMKTKVSNELKLVIDGKEVDLEQFFKQEAKEDAHADTDAIKDAENEEMVETEAKDEIETENEDTDKRALIDEIGGILKDNGLDDEVIRTIIGKAEKIAYDGSEASESDNEMPEDDDKNGIEIPGEDEPAEDDKVENGCKSKNEDIEEDEKREDFTAKVANAMAKRDNSMRRAYNAAAEVLGEFNPFGMTERDMLVRALNHAGIDDVNKASTRELYAMLKVANHMGRVDSAFSYDGGNGSDSVEINI